jgi:molybdenum cofactor cytidylyltransferase
MSYNAIILAAGNSSRMGMPKWSLRMPSGESFAEYIIAGYKKCGIDSILVVGHDHQAALKSLLKSTECIIVPNPDTEKGRMYSMQCGLQMAGNPDGVFIHNTDNPFFNSGIILSMISALQFYDYVVPVYNNKGGHPVLIGRRLIETIPDLTSPLPILRDFLDMYQGIRLPVSDKQVLLNINSHEDYKRFIAGE